MASTYTPSLKIQLMATGENTTTWGDTTNDNLRYGLEQALVGSATVTFASGDVTLTLSDLNTSQPARNMRLLLSGTTGGARNLIFGSGANNPKLYIVSNGCADAVTVKNTTGTGIAVPAGKTMWVYNDGTDVIDVVTHLTSLTLGSALPVASGGTGQNTYTNGELLIGNTTGNTLTKATLTAGSGVTVTNGGGSITISATGAGGTVTSVNGSGGTTGLTLAGGPITASGTLTLGGTLGAANGGTGQNTYTNGQLLIGNTTGNTLTKATLTAGSGVSITNGTGSITISSTGLGGTVTSVNGAGGTTGLTLTGGPITASGTLTLGGTLAVANGGTGQNTYTNGELLIGNTTGNTLTKATLTAGSGITITNGTGAITISATGAGGSVTSVNGSGGTTGLTLTGGPITTTGTLTLGGTLAVANGGTGATTLTGYVKGSGTSALTASATIPTSDLSGAIAVANGGTGLTTFTAANNAIFSTSSSALTAGTLPITAGGTGATSASAARTALGAAASGTNTDITSLQDGVTIAAGGSVTASTIGFRGLPQVAKTASYTLELTDAGKHISTTAGVVIPANSSLSFPTGTAIAIYNSSGGNITLSITSDTLRLAGTTTTGNRTLANHGLATITKVASTTWVISGAGLS